MYVATVRGYSIYGIEPGSAQGSNARYVSKAGVRTSVPGLPLLKPPYGSIVAIDMNTGEHAWRIPNGDTPDNIKTTRVEIPAPTNTAPMMYMHNGKQYIVLSVAGEGNAGRARGSDAHRRIGL